MYSGENIALDFCMQELLKVDVDRALQFGFSALKDACFNKKSRNSLQMRIADAIFARNIFMPDEADCILQAFFSSDEIHLRCALQAFYFLQEVSDTSKLLLMELIHERLSGRILLDDETASVETWLPKVAACYSLYVLFKEKNKDPIFTALCQRLANEYTRSQQAGAFSPNWATLFQPTETENVILDAKVARNKV